MESIHSRHVPNSCWEAEIIFYTGSKVLDYFGKLSLVYDLFLQTNFRLAGAISWTLEQNYLEPRQIVAALPKKLALMSYPIAPIFSLSSVPLKVKPLKQHGLTGCSANALICCINLIYC